MRAPDIMNSIQQNVKGFGWWWGSQRKQEEEEAEESKAHLTLVSDLADLDLDLAGNKGSKNQVACPRRRISTSDGHFMTPDNEKNPTNWFQKQSSKSDNRGARTWTPTCKTIIGRLLDFEPINNQSVGRWTWIQTEQRNGCSDVLIIHFPMEW